jgi:hypothetical protein
MCDYISGELILCFPKVDPAAQQLIEDIRRDRIEHVTHLESLAGKMARLGLRPDEEMEFDFHRVRVPIGEEHWKITYLQFFYKIKLLELLTQGQPPPEFMDVIGRSDYQLTIVPNSVLSLANSKPLGKAKVKAANFTFSKFHSEYKKSVRIPDVPPPDIDQITVAIIDSGIADDAVNAGCVVVDGRNFVDPAATQDVDDEIGHGTVIALILSKLAPGARLIVYKVSDADGRVSEWDTLAALSACANVQIVNLSLQFGLVDRACKVCGRESHSSRSAVFENIIRQFAKRERQPVLVGAAGNGWPQGSNNLAFPARFSELLAVGAVNSQGALSVESNYGKQYNDVGIPDNHFVCPGGDTNVDPPEVIGSFGVGDDTRWHGTSFAAAYASGVVANLLAQEGEDNAQYSSIMEKLRDNADSQGLAGYDSTKHGHGLMRLTG